MCAGFLNVYPLFVNVEGRLFGRKGLSLTRRETEVLGLLMQGHTNKKIAQRLNISDFTVRDHVSALLAKHGVENRMMLIIVVSRTEKG